MTPAELLAIEEGICIQCGGDDVEVEEVAEMALFLCGPNSGSINGTALSIYGGWTAQ